MPLSLQPYGIAVFAILAVIVIINEAIKFFKGRHS